MAALGSHSLFLTGCCLLLDLDLLLFRFRSTFFELEPNYLVPYGKFRKFSQAEQRAEPSSSSRNSATSY